MSDTTLGALLSLVGRCVCLVCGLFWQHPLLSTGVCLLLTFYHQNDQEVRKQLRELYLRICAALQKKRASQSAIYGCVYGYNMAQGPHNWPVGQSAEFQSPINIEERAVRKLPIRELLNWNHYDDLPASIELENTGHTLVLRAHFHGNAPTLSGADLLASYTFVELRFHWGWCNSEGSEHTFNNKKFPLELQVMHRAGAGSPRPCTSSYDLLMIAYVFELSAHNPFLDPLIQNLKLVQMPGKKVHVAPFPLSYLIYTFRAGFYSYGGSLTEPPCYQGTEWFIFPETLAISEFQLRHFRQLLCGDGVTPITRNSRPVQQLGSRCVNVNYFCPYDAAQLARLRAEVREQQEAQEEADMDAGAFQQPQLELETELEEEFATAVSEDEGQLIETIDTTTIITTSSNTSICMTTLKRSDVPDSKHCLPNCIVINSCGGGGNNDHNNNNINCGHCCNGGKCDEEQAMEMALEMSEGAHSSCDCDAICGVGDGVGVGVGIGVRIELIE